MTTKSEFLNLLKNNVLVVNFVKKDGSTRKLMCTLQESVVNELAIKGIGTRKVPDHQVCCIDVEKNAFRSFTVDSVIDYSIA